MHEWALAEAVIFSAINFSKEKGIKIKEITVSLGELQQIDEEIFDFALGKIMKTMGLKFSVKKKREKALLKCSACEEDWNFDSQELKEEEKEAVHFIPEIVHDYVKCPKCGSPDFRIIKGRGVWLNSVKGE